MIAKSDFDELYRVAEESYRNSRAPYSKFKVGAALLTDKGIFGGSLVENAAYPSTVCAGMVAVYNAVSSGATVLKVAAVQFDEGVPTPCGMCEQIMKSFNVKEAYSKSSHSTEWIKVMENGSEYKPYLEKKTWEILDYSGFQFVWTPPSILIRNLVLGAIEACKYAHIPISNFPVGSAVIQSGSNEIITGSNCETLPLGLGLCAERVTIAKAITHGFKEISAIAVCCAKLPDFGKPCGGCRQVIREFGNVTLYLIKLDWEKKEIDVEQKNLLDILPDSFGPENL